MKKQNMRNMRNMRNTRNMRRQMQSLKDVFGKWLIMTDDRILDIAIGTVIANMWKNNPIWILLVGPSASSKSQIIDAMSIIPQAYPLSEWSTRAMLSGKGEAHSEIFQLTDKILLVRELHTILSKREDTQREILGQMREIYDGRVSKAFGQGKKISWEGHVGFLGGATPEIDRTRGLFNALGERFVLWRLPQENMDALGMRAASNSNSAKQLKEELSRAMLDFFDNMDSLIFPRITKKDLTLFKDLAIVTAYGRTSVARDRYSKEIEVAPVPETPGRLVQVFVLLAQAIAFANGRSQIGAEEHGIIKKIAQDTMIAYRKTLLELMYYTKLPLSTHEISQEMSVPSTTAAIHAQNLWALGCVDRLEDEEIAAKIGDRTVTLSRKRGQTVSYLWQLSKKFRERLERCGIFE